MKTVFQSCNNFKSCLIYTNPINRERKPKKSLRMLNLSFLWDRQDKQQLSRHVRIPTVSGWISENVQKITEGIIFKEALLEVLLSQAWIIFMCQYVVFTPSDSYNFFNDLQSSPLVGLIQHVIRHHLHFCLWFIISQCSELFKKECNVLMRIPF